MTNTLPPADITEAAINILCRELGPVATARFLHQMSNGAGDYTAERDQLIGSPTVEQLAAELAARRAAGTAS